MHSEEQAARAMWKKGYRLKDAGDLTGSERLFQKAMDVWHLRMPDDHRLVHELQGKDWSDLITCWFDDQGVYIPSSTGGGIDR